MKILIENVWQMLKLQHFRVILFNSGLLQRNSDLTPANDVMLKLLNGQFNIYLSNTWYF